MPRTRDQKKQKIEEYKEQIENSKALFFVRPKGITPNQAVELKKALYTELANFNVVKNTLFRIALKDAGINIELEDQENAIVFSDEKISAVAKIIKEFIKETEKAEIRAGFVEGKRISEAEVNALAELPSRDVLLAQVLATMQAPVSGFVRVLDGNLSGFVNVVNAIKDQKS